MDLYVCQVRSFGEYTGLLDWIDIFFHISFFYFCFIACRKRSIDSCLIVSLFFPFYDYQVLILGLDHAGKTSLLEQLKRMYSTQQPMPISMIPPTVGLNGDKIQLIFVMGVV